MSIWLTPCQPPISFNFANKVVHEWSFSFMPISKPTSMLISTYLQQNANHKTWEKLYIPCYIFSCIMFPIKVLRYNNQIGHHRQSYKSKSTFYSSVFGASIGSLKPPIKPTIPIEQWLFHIFFSHHKCNWHIPCNVFIMISRLRLSSNNFLKCYIFSCIHMLTNL